MGEPSWDSTFPRRSPRSLVEVSAGVVGRDPSGLGTGLTGFRLLSDLGDHLGVAQWGPAGFTCDQELLDRARIVVALGESVGDPDGPGPVAATTSADRPLDLLLTLIRAGRVIDCRMTLGAISAEPAGRHG